MVEGAFQLRQGFQRPQVPDRGGRFKSDFSLGIIDERVEKSGLLVDRDRKVHDSGNRGLPHHGRRVLKVFDQGCLDLGPPSSGKHVEQLGLLHRVRGLFQMAQQEQRRLRTAACQKSPGSLDTDPEVGVPEESKQLVRQLGKGVHLERDQDWKQLRGILPGKFPLEQVDRVCFRGERSEEKGETLGELERPGTLNQGHRGKVEGQGPFHPGRFLEGMEDVLDDRLLTDTGGEGERLDRRKAQGERPRCRTLFQDVHGFLKHPTPCRIDAGWSGKQLPQPEMGKKRKGRIGVEKMLFENLPVARLGLPCQGCKGYPSFPGFSVGWNFSWSAQVFISQFVSLSLPREVRISRPRGPGSGSEGRRAPRA